MTLRKGFIVLGISLWATGLSAVQSTDSLLAVLEKPVHDSARVKALFTLARSLAESNKDTARHYYDEAVDLAVSSDLPLYEAIARLYLGNFLNNNGAFDQALEEYAICRQVFTDLKQTKWLTKTHNSIGLAYLGKSEFAIALDYYQNALALAKEMGNREQECSVLNNIGTIHRREKDFTKAFEYYQQAAIIAEEIGDKEAVFRFLLSMGTVYHYMAYETPPESGSKLDDNAGIPTTMQKQLVESAKYYEQALEVAVEIDKKIAINKSLNNLGIVYADMGDHELALDYYTKSVALAYEIGNRRDVSAGYIGFAASNHALGNYDTALVYAARSLEVAREIGSNTLIQDCYREFTKSYSAKGDYEQAYKYLHRFMAKKDSIYNEAKSEQITEMETRFQTQQKEQEITVLSQENEIQQLQLGRNRTMIISLAAALGLLMVIAFLFIRQNRLRARQQNMELRYKATELEHKALRAQINPHFIFNALNSIQRFFIKGDQENAYEYMGKFSTLMRSVLDNSDTSFTTVEEELKALELYLQIERLRVDNKFDFDIKVDESIDQSMVELPSMVMQPYVENAIWHGVMHKQNKGLIKLEVHRNNGSLLLAVEDNGVGRERASQISRQNPNKHKSAGTRLVEERLEALNSMHDTHMQVRTIDLMDSGNALGTRIEIEIPQYA